MKLPRRYKNNVGKSIGGCVYVHKAYAEEVAPNLALYKDLLSHAPLFDIVKFKLRSKDISFISCPNFDTEDEPQVISSCSHKSKPWKAPASGVIYHHKWLFVKDDYEGFDVEASKERSRRWMALPDIDYSRIGNKRYWEAKIVPKIA